MNIQIFDGLGRRVDMKRVTLTNGMVQISTQSLSNGTYRMIIDNGSKMTVKQFVVIK
ncbi:MAG: T9SS type A sorting domain-containing protein [Saprospiraceae bacterium]|nr:MAG: T9SS type A sorting domain-containing protein [Saprospiraceae bacterium]